MDFETLLSNKFEDMEKRKIRKQYITFPSLQAINEAIAVYSMYDFYFIRKEEGGKFPYVVEVLRQP